MGRNTNFGAIELKSENGEIYGEGFVSTTDPDLYKDIVSEEAQNSIFKQLKDRVIKLDLDHDKFRDPETGEIYEEPKNLIPPGKIINVELKKTPDGSLGNWVKVQFNKSHSKFKELINSIEDGYIDGFSIAYKVTDSNTLNKLGETYRNIKNLIIHNIAVTGDAVNRKTGLKIALKSFPKKMDNKIEELNQEILQLKSEHKAELSKVQAELKAKDKELSDKEKEALKMKADKEDSDKKEKTEMKSISDKKDKDILELKSKVESNVTEITELKSKVDEYEAMPQLKDIKVFQAEMKSQLFDKNDKPKLWGMNQ